MSGIVVNGIKIATIPEETGLTKDANVSLQILSCNISDHLVIWSLYGIARITFVAISPEIIGT